jgi:hypothetical protein
MVLYLIEIFNRMHNEVVNDKKSKTLLIMKRVWNHHLNIEQILFPSHFRFKGMFPKYFLNIC